jgi:hypothetical protein
MATYHDLSSLAKALGGEVSAGQILAPGPGHSADDRSLSIKLDSAAPEGFLVHSFAGDDPINCRHYVREKLGSLPFQLTKSGNSKAWSPVTASYIYRDRNAAPYLRVQRTATKQFFQQHWDGANWIKGKPQGPKVPYRLPELLAANPTTLVYICEGEKDADNLAKLGFLATCNSGGADAGNGSKWTAELNTYFKDRHVYILPDNDAPGRQHGQHVARSLYSVAASVRIVALPGLPPKGDVTDWLKTDPSGARLVQVCERAPLWEHGAEDDQNWRDCPSSLMPAGAKKRRKNSASPPPLSMTSSRMRASLRVAGDHFMSTGILSPGRSRSIVPPYLVPSKPGSASTL